jgi:hypothetical protein
VVPLSDKRKTAYLESTSTNNNNNEYNSNNSRIKLVMHLSRKAVTKSTRPSGPEKGFAATLSKMPNFKPSSAEIILPLAIMSKAFLTPIMRGRRCVPPAPVVSHSHSKINGLFLDAVF